MTDRPILFSGPMVRAILDGSKTQTRRVVKWRELNAGLNLGFSGLRAERTALGWVLESDTRDSREWRCKPTPSPYGQPCDRLWVREAWRVIDVADCFAPRQITAAHRIWFEADAPHDGPVGRYRPGMFMPRWASRITLEVTEVRVERLQDISEADAMAEGSFGWAGEQDTPARDLPEARLVYRQLWESINGPGSWDANPWVWVVEFRRLP